MNERYYDESIQRPVSARNYPGLEQLMCLAISDPNFAAQLLTDPAGVLERLPTTIQLSPIERRLIASIPAAKDIHDFAALLWAKAFSEREILPAEE